jgi:hypothetical protein
MILDILDERSDLGFESLEIAMRDRIRVGIESRYIQH